MASVGDASLGARRPPRLGSAAHQRPLGVAASSVRDVVYFGGHGAGGGLWTLVAWALAGVVGQIVVTGLRRPAPVLAEPVLPPVDLVEPISEPRSTSEPVAVQPVTPIIVTGRSYHAVHHVIGSVPVRLLHESPYPVITI